MCGCGCGMSVGVRGADVAGLDGLFYLKTGWAMLRFTKAPQTAGNVRNVATRWQARRNEKMNSKRE
eukprot:357488-Chlamydomonas_euryale.AAC.8